MVGPDDVLGFWLDECGPEQWYALDDALDDTIRKRFGQAWQGATEGQYALWLTYPSGVLAYVILTDQFSRNMFRGDAKAFSTDCAARAAAKMAIDKEWDMRIDAPARQFFYMPLEHSENLSDQDRAVRLISERMRTDADGLLHARAHREIIRQFGRFPFRNEVLGRKSTSAELAFLESGGYGAMLRRFQPSAAA
ncbi:DUF924 family protein [uncultured Tateyamaria sp.]|uniref:DUF924 family protein n=1 Tax=uncultured Tateyamaria sp. TaxID=455651 RepID=UPI00263038F6|nr:DUF924 family protein [uncultured Tateyamaria sp.]